MTLLRIDSICLNFTDRGQGHPLLFVHGFPLNQTMWNAQCDALALNFRVIAPDLRGFGQSDGVDNVFTMEQFADDLAMLLDRLHVEEPVTLCALSMGGYIAWQFVERYPERIDCMILCNTRAGADTTEAAENRYRLAELVMQHGPQAAADAMLPRLFSKETVETRPEVVESVRRMILGNRPESIAAALRGMAIRPDMSALLPEITVPALMIVGAEDQITPPDEMRRVAHEMASCRVIEVPGAGHLTPMEKPRVVNQAIQKFLAVRA